MIRLYRGALAGEFAIENRWYRDAGREIAVYRDSTAAVEAVEGLDRHTRAEVGRTAMRRLLRTVRSARDARYANKDDLRGRIDNIVAQLPIGSARVHDCAVTQAGGFEQIAVGLRRTFADGRQAMATAYETEADTAFHEWRKRVKDHWYHIQLLTVLWPEMMQIRAKALRDLSQHLGRHHDLTVVRNILAGQPETFGGELEATRVADLLRARQQHLATRARPIGARLFADAPKQFVAQVEGLWNAWVSG